MDLKSRERFVQKVAWISVFSNIILMIGKIVIGWLGNSNSVFADGIHSAADVFASLIVLFVIKISNKPADEEHPYGHGKAEVIVSAIIGMILFLVSFYIIYDAVTGIFHPIKTPSILALAVALLSYALKHWLYRYSLTAAKKHTSKAIEAIAFDHKADIAASIAAAAGVILSIAGGKFGLAYLLYGDKLASIFVAYLIFKIAKEMIMESFNILLERNISAETLGEYEAIIQTFHDVRRIDQIRAREHGHYIVVDLRISIDYFKNIKEGHDLTRDIRNTLKDQYDNISEVLIHVNPYFPDEEKN